MKNQIKGLIFDYGGVISRPQKENHVSTMLQILDYGKKEKFQSIYRNFRPEYDAGLITGVEYWKRVIDGLGLQSSEIMIDHLIEQDVLSWTDVNPMMIEYIKSFNIKEIKLATLSNMTFETLVYMRENFDWLRIFDRCVFSCEIKTTKPGAAIYQYCLDQLNLRPEDCVFIDDMAENIVGAEKCGLKTHRYESINDLKEYLGQQLRFI